MSELEAQETVVIEREFDDQGRVTKETRTVSKPRRVERSIEPRTPLELHPNPVGERYPNIFPNIPPPQTYEQRYGGTTTWRLPPHITCGPPPGSEYFGSFSA